MNRVEGHNLKMSRLNHTAGSDQSGLDDTLVESNPFGPVSSMVDDLINLRAKPPIPIGLVPPSARLS